MSPTTSLDQAYFITTVHESSLGLPILLLLTNMGRVEQEAAIFGDLGYARCDIVFGKLSVGVLLEFGATEYSTTYDYNDETGELYSNPLIESIVEDYRKNYMPERLKALEKEIRLNLHTLSEKPLSL